MSTEVYSVSPRLSYQRNPWLQRFSPVVQLQILASIYTDLEFHQILAHHYQATALCAEPFVLFAVCYQSPKPSTYKLAELVNTLIDCIPSSAQIGWLDHTTVGIISNTEQLHALLQKLPPKLRAKVNFQPYYLPQDWDQYCAQYAHYVAASYDEQYSSTPVQASRPMYIPWWKRAFDVGLTGLSLCVLLPLFLLIAGYIYAVSPGPIFFTQERIGFRGQKFTMWKFRSMYINVDTKAHQQHLAELIKNSHGGEKPMQKLDSQNKQIIPLGKMIRKTSLDELPQLFNAIFGTMSLIGPRPPIPYEVDEYLAWHWGRFNALPGMTGLWQVSGKNHLRFSQMARLDICYAIWCSPWVDLDILLRTPGVVIKLALEKTKHEK